ncbi:MAG: hypothetical protein ACE366_10045 [Bradymonadia bacterium]
MSRWRKFEGRPRGVLASVLVLVLVLGCGITREPEGNTGGAGGGFGGAGAEGGAGGQGGAGGEAGFGGQVGGAGGGGGAGGEAGGGGAPGGAGGGMGGGGGAGGFPGGMGGGGGIVPDICSQLCQGVVPCLVDGDPPICPDLDLEDPEGRMQAQDGCVAACETRPDLFEDAPEVSCEVILDQMLRTTPAFGAVCGPDLYTPCPDDVPLLEGVVDEHTLSVVDDTLGGTTTHSGTCGGVGPELMYRFEAPVPGLWDFFLETEAPENAPDAVLHLRSLCDVRPTELACSADTPDGRAAVRMRLEGDASVFVFVDSLTPEGGPFTLTIRRVEEIPEGQPCEVASVEHVCVEGLLCLPSLMEDGSVCRLPAPPLVEMGEAFYNTATGGFGARLTAHAEAPLTGYRYTLLDPEQVPIATESGQGPFVTEGFHMVSRPDPMGPYALTLLETLPAQLEGLATVRLQLLDTFGAEGLEIDLPVQPSLVADSGGACDPDGIFTLCPEGERCAVEVEPPTCTPVEE